MGEKAKGLWLIIGIAIGVYVGMKYLLPFVAPFFIAYIVVRLMLPLIGRLQKKIKLKKELLATILLTVFAVVLAGGVYLLGRQLLIQAKEVISNFDIYQGELNHVIGNCCSMLEDTLGIDSSSAKQFIYNNIDIMAEQIKVYFVPDMVNQSVRYLFALVKGLGVFFALFVAILLIIKDYDDINEKLDKYELYRRTSAVMDRLWSLGGDYLKAQLLIMGLVCILCVLGLWITGNPYALLIGLLIGVLDALPFIGTGTILVPWALICLVRGDFFHGAAYVTLFFLCNGVREYLEPKLIGKKLGVYPIVIVITVYVGICLYGVSGILLGPLTLLTTIEIFKEISEEGRPG